MESTEKNMMNEEAVESTEKVEVVPEKTDEEQLQEMSDVVEAKEKAEDEKISKIADEQFKVEEGRGEFKRESREDRFAREAQEKLDAWVPKTQLGKEVRSGKIKNIDEIFERCEKIMEPQIVDLLIPGLKTDTLFIGQSKGKFGGKLQKDDEYEFDPTTTDNLPYKDAFTHFRNCLGEIKNFYELLMKYLLQ